MAFKAVRTVLTLDPRDLVTLQEILVDEDRAEALNFLQTVIAEKIRCAQDESHRPEFEGGVRIQESHQASKGAGHLKPGESR